MRINFSEQILFIHVRIATIELVLAKNKQYQIINLKKYGILNWAKVGQKDLTSKVQYVRRDICGQIF